MNLLQVRSREDRANLIPIAATTKCLIYIEINQTKKPNNSPKNSSSCQRFYLSWLIVTEGRFPKTDSIRGLSELWHAKKFQLLCIVTGVCSALVHSLKKKENTVPCFNSNSFVYEAIHFLCFWDILPSQPFNWSITHHTHTLPH